MVGKVGTFQGDKKDKQVDTEYKRFGPKPKIY